MYLRGINLWAIFHIYQISGIRNAMFRLFGPSPFNIDPQRNIWLSDQKGICKDRWIWIIDFSSSSSFLMSRLTTGPLHLLFFLTALPSDILKGPSCLTIFLYSHYPFLPWSFWVKTAHPSLTFSTSSSSFFYTTYYHETYYIFIWVPLLY